MSQRESGDITMPGSRLVAGAIGLLIIIFILGFAIVAVGPVMSAEGNLTDHRRASPDPVTGSAVSFEDTSADSGDINRIKRVNDSTGFALRFTGANDSHLSSNADINLSNGNWTIHTGVAINQSSLDADNMTVLAAGDPDVIVRYHNRSGQRANYSAYILTDETHVVNVSADGDNATRLQHVFVNRSGDNVTIRRNTSVGETVNTTTSGDFGGTLNASHENALHGRMDETRVFNESLNASQRNALINDPVGPLPNATRTARIMYDEGSGTTTEIFFASSDATLSNATWVKAGYDGHILTDGTDFTIDEDDGTITALSGGRIDGAPVVWVFYVFEEASILEAIRPITESALSVGVVIVIAVPIVAVLGLILMVAVDIRELMDDSGRFGR